MARTDIFTGLSEFLAVAQRASFRAAAADLGVTPAAVTKAVRALEHRIGLPALMHSLALAGVGLMYASDLIAEHDLAEGRLERVLEGYLPKTPGLFLCFAARSQMQPKLRVFIDAARSLTKRRARSESGA